MEGGLKRKSSKEAECQKRDGEVENRYKVREAECGGDNGLVGQTRAEVNRGDKRMKWSKAKEIAEEVEKAES